MSNVIIFRKNEKDEYFRKSVDFASSDVILKEDVKASGAVERLSATILKGIQDQLFDIARQDKIQAKSKKLFLKISKDYKAIYIEKYIERVSKNKTKTSLEQITEEANNSYALKKKSLDRLAEKESWRSAINTEVKDEELLFFFDAKSILDYAKIFTGQKRRLYDDVLKIQERFNRWTEKRFDTTTGQIEDKEISGVLFPISTYNHGTNATIEIKLEKGLLHCVLFFSQQYLRYHLENYIKVETPNATRLYEILIDYISDNLFVSNRELTFEYIQKKFNTEYKAFRDLIKNVIVKSLEKINLELKTSISLKYVKKGNSIQRIFFEISQKDKDILQGEWKDVINESSTLSFEFYLTLLRLKGERAHTGLKSVYEAVRSEVNNGTYVFADTTKEEAFQDYRQNIIDASHLEQLLDDEPTLAEQYAYDKNYLNIIRKRDMEFVGITASESLQYIRESFLIPRGLISPVLPQFSSFDGEKARMADTFPFKIWITPKKSITIDSNNFDLMKTTIVTYIAAGEVDKIEFESDRAKRCFYTVFDLKYDSDKPEIEAEVVNTDDVDDDEPIAKDIVRRDGLFLTLSKMMSELENRSFKKSPSQWVEATEKLCDKYGIEPVEKVFNFLASGHQDAIFWLGNVPTPNKLIAHFEKIELQMNAASAAIKIKSDGLENREEDPLFVVRLGKEIVEDAKIGEEEARLMAKERCRYHAIAFTEKLFKSAFAVSQEIIKLQGRIL